MCVPLSASTGNADCSLPLRAAGKARTGSCPMERDERTEAKSQNDLQKISYTNE